ncbi:MAG TPA: MSMEG_4193 family putative phosphomutase [Actinomycetota bacterium]|nr:MSMEG_4193 family putative phosphomutase [Actinomycetota bacterium]
MTLLLLVRHALTDATGKRLSGSTPGVHLSEEGRRQARELAERLAGLRLTEVLSSPLERCRETALAIAERHGLPVVTVPELEEVGYGEWTGHSIARVSRTRLWRQLHQAPSSVRFPGGETLAEAQRRAVGALEEAAARSPRGVVVVVTHADIIRLALAHYAGVHLDLFQRLTVSPASVSAVALGDRIPRVLRVNDTGSLQDLVGRERPGPTHGRSRRPKGRAEGRA